MEGGLSDDDGELHVDCDSDFEPDAEPASFDVLDPAQDVSELIPVISVFYRYDTYRIF